MSSNDFETVREGIGYSQDVPEADDAYAAAEAALGRIEAEVERLRLQVAAVSPKEVADYLPDLLDKAEQLRTALEEITEAYIAEDRLAYTNSPVVQRARAALAKEDR